MKVFEFQFNPAESKDRFFKTFSSERLFFVGELVNALPQNAPFLNNLANAAQNEYYAVSGRDLKKTLQKINGVLQEQIKNGNVDWMGNLHAALFAFSHKGLNQIFSFAKSGNIKVLISRRGAFTDLGKTMENFKNFVSGAVLPDDKIIVCTKELFDVLLSQNLLHDLAFFNEEKQFRELFRTKEKELKKVSGVLFSLVIEQTSLQSKKKALQFKIPKLRIPSFKIPVPALPKISIKIPILSSPERRRITLLSLFCAILLMGFGVFGTREDEITTVALQKAKNLESNEKFLEAWGMLLPLADSKKSLPKEFFALKKELESKLLPLYFLQEIKTPELFYQIKREETNLIANSMLFSNNHLYASNPFSSQVFEIDIEKKKGAVVSASKNIKSGTAFLDSAVFFEEPNTIAQITQGQALKEADLQGKQNLSVESMSSFGKNLYLFDSRQGEIIKFANPLNEKAASARWLDFASTKKATGAKSLSVDGFAWLLLNGNEIQKYYAGAYQESLKPQIFPPLLHGLRLKTSANFQYLYLLDPWEKRIILLTKSGRLLKQYRSAAFDTLLDFAVSDNEKAIYLLNGSLIFRILL